MNDDLYGHELSNGEEVMYSQSTYKTAQTGPVAVMVIVASFATILNPDIPALLSSWLRTVPHFALLPGFLAVFVLVRLVSETLRYWFKPRLALVTNQRVIAPNGLDIPLSNISKVHGRWSTVKLDGQKLADGLTIRDMQDARAFRTAIERQLA